MQLEFDAMWQIILILLALLYLLNPYDILPDPLVGLGWLDDIVIIGLLLHYFVKRRKNRTSFQQEHHRHQNSDSTGSEYAGSSRYRTHNQGDRPSSEPRDPYQVLGIERGASPETIKQAYRELAGKYHPDKVEYLGDEFKALAEKRFKEIQKAYEELRRD
jgi:DnaJ like chaperone protein